MDQTRFRNRVHAGAFLATQLASYAGREDVVVLALPRGGVPVGYAIASALRAPLDVFIVRKLGVPGHEELAMGAIAHGGVRVVNDSLVDSLSIREEDLQAVAHREAGEVERRERLYRGSRPYPDLRHRTVILVDDGIATGASVLAAIRALKRLEVSRLVVAVPVGSPESCRTLQAEADEVVCALTPEPFHAVGQFYEDFSQTTDDEVRSLLDAAERRQLEAVARVAHGG